MNSNKGQTSKKNSSAKTADLFNDPDYIQLVDNFQSGDFPVCAEILQNLKKQYPDHSELQRFEEDLEMKISLNAMAESNNEQEKQKSKKTLIKMSAFAVLGTIIVLVVFFVSYLLLNLDVTDEQLAVENEQLYALTYQAEQLLRAGQPQPAVEIIKKMITINPDFVELPELIMQSDNLLQLETDYQSALDLIADEEYDQAMDILENINGQRPGLWDVNKQITSIETIYQIQDFVKEGTAAYAVENWDGVIAAYENASKLDPQLDTPLVKEHLLRGYLNKIISMLDNENTTMDDIVQAEEYYRRAIAMIPQNRTFANERENLQRASDNLLELKFTEIAKESLEDTDQTVTTIDRAVSFLKTTASIKPDNQTLQSDLMMAEYYQAGFESYIRLDWEKAVANFDKIVTVDPDYANGNANALLVESYYALGKQYFSAGFYLDAVNRLEQAEILAWYDTDNLMKLFQIQILIGDATGKLQDYPNAVSYYKYAVDVVDAQKKLGDYPELAAKLAEAKTSTALGNHKKSFDEFQLVLKEIEKIYSVSEVEIEDGACIALFAKENASTVNAILEANDLPYIMVISFGREIKVPIIE